MKTKVIRTQESGWVDQAAAILRSGGVVAFPTDTVYGVGASVREGHAVRRLYEIKRRAEEKPIPLLISDADSIEAFAKRPSAAIQRMLARFWPGPLTIILEARPGLPREVSRYGTVGIRIPDLPAARKLLREAGPMAVTSANLSGHTSLTAAGEVYEQLKDRIDLLVDGGETPGGISSTVIDCTGDSIEIIREGPISIDAILEAVSGG